MLYRKRLIEIALPLDATTPNRPVRNPFVMATPAHFTYGGRVVFSSKELQIAAEMQENYHLVGVLDDHQSERQWSTFIISNPLETLLSNGGFVVKPNLEVAAKNLFIIE